MAKQPQRYWCEDLSPTLREIKNSKKNGKTITLNGTIYEYVGDNLVFNTKTNKIEKL
jgi:phage terminase large subunit-like protein